VELKGTAEATQPLISYLAGQPCVQYRWRIEEHWSRTVTETYTDSDGKTQTRTRHEEGCNNHVIVCKFGSITHPSGL